MSDITDEQVADAKLYSSITALISAIPLFILSMYMLNSQKFARHPYRLIATALLFESIFYGFEARDIFQEQLQNMITDFVAAHPWWEFILLNTDHAFVLWVFLIQVYVIMSQELYFNTCLFLDLYLTIKNPLFSSGKREKTYFLLSGVLFIGVVLATCIYLQLNFG